MRKPNKHNKLNTAVQTADQVPELPLSAPNFEAYEKEVTKVLWRGKRLPVEPAVVQTKTIGKSK
jgi:hypothetical protein